jgi:hypothetical protein
MKYFVLLLFVNFTGILTSQRWLDVQEMCRFLPKYQKLFSEVKDAVMYSKEHTIRKYKYSFVNFQNGVRNNSFLFCLPHL